MEMVPRTCWWSNLRSVLPSERWDQVRRAVYRRAEWRCEVCGSWGTEHPLEAHEVWSYDDHAHRQVLIRIAALCPMCHQCCHLGHAQASVSIQEVLDHLRILTDRLLPDLVALQNRCEERSRHPWTVHLAVLREHGFSFGEIAELEQRAARERSATR